MSTVGALVILFSLLLPRLSSINANSDEIQGYHQYLLKFGKDVLSHNKGNGRISNKISTIAVQEYEAAYEVGLNEFSDMSPQEIDSLFHDVPVPPLPAESNFVEPTWLSQTSSTLSPDFNTSNLLGSPLLLSSGLAGRIISRGTGLNPPDSVSWASSENSVQEAVVDQVQNQGTCGACWAFSALSSVHASLKLSTDRKIPLSAQELIDCDTVYDKGCQGGNPIYAFEYIMTHGISKKEEYLPYHEKQGSCTNMATTSRIFIQGYIRIYPGSQQVLKRFVGIGPVATGICGTDPSFIYYSKGIFNKASCCNVQNHAILIVGYGTDPVSGLDYWLLQNSWGSKWGEDGFMRLLRTDEPTTGLCSLSVTPAMAYGGYIINTTSFSGNSSNPNGPNFHIGFIHWRMIVSLVSIWLQRHWQAVVLTVSSLLLVASLILFAYTSYLADQMDEEDDESREVRSGNARLLQERYYQGGWEGSYPNEDHSFVLRETASGNNQETNASALYGADGTSNYEMKAFSISTVHNTQENYPHMIAVREVREEESRHASSQGLVSTSAALPPLSSSSTLNNSNDSNPFGTYGTIN